MKTCSSCNQTVTKNFIEFRCPECQKHAIVRCAHCRTTSKEYICPECNFEGP